MADEADHAQEIEQLALEQALARRLPGENLVPNGFCYNCHEPLKPSRIKNKPMHTKRFCDQYCRDDFETRRRSERQRRT